MSENKKKRWVENLTFWTALLTFLTTVIDKISDMFRKDAASTHLPMVGEGEEEIMYIVTESDAPSAVSWSGVLMFIAVLLLVLVIVVKIRRKRREKRVVV